MPNPGLISLLPTDPETQGPNTSSTPSSPSGSATAGGDVAGFSSFVWSNSSINAVDGPGNSATGAENPNHFRVKCQNPGEIVKQLQGFVAFNMKEKDGGGSGEMRSSTNSNTSSGKSNGKGSKGQGKNNNNNNQTTNRRINATANLGSNDGLLHSLASIPQILALCGDKSSMEVRECAKVTLLDIQKAKELKPFCVRQFLRAIGSSEHGLGGGGLARPEQKMISLQLVKNFADNEDGKIKCIVRQELANLIPLVNNLINDAKKDVCSMAKDTMESLFKCCGNKDIIGSNEGEGKKSLLPTILRATTKGAENPLVITESIEELAGCIFVSKVESPALAVMLPILTKGLEMGNSDKTIRRTCIIINNMIKLVEDGSEVYPLIPKIFPMLTSRLETVSDPEARTVVRKAWDRLDSLLCRSGSGKGTGGNRSRLGLPVTSALEQTIGPENMSLCGIGWKSSVSGLYYPTRQSAYGKLQGQFDDSKMDDGSQGSGSQQISLQKLLFITDALISMTFANADSYNACSDDDGNLFKKEDFENALLMVLGDQYAAAGKGQGEKIMNKLQKMAGKDQDSLNMKKTEVIRSAPSTPKGSMAKGKDKGSKGSGKGSKGSDKDNNKKNSSGSNKSPSQISTTSSDNNTPASPPLTLPNPAPKDSLYCSNFTLAFGSSILLRESPMCLQRGRFYALLGSNGCGKTTLMRALSGGKVDGFPTLEKDNIRVTYLEHDIEDVPTGKKIHISGTGQQVDQMTTDLTGCEWILRQCNEVYKIKPALTEKQVHSKMTELGFAGHMPHQGLTTYSGGWRVKMQLCAITLFNCDILLLDEPSAHMDTKNKQWLADWLKNSFMNQKGHPPTCICTSHDPQFLDALSTDIIWFETQSKTGSELNNSAGLKLNQTGNWSGISKDSKLINGPKAKGVLSAWVNENPSIRSNMLSLSGGDGNKSGNSGNFNLPSPGPLEGIRSRGKPIVRMNNVTFSYAKAAAIAEQQKAMNEKHNKNNHNKKGNNKGSGKNNKNANNNNNNSDTQIKIPAGPNTVNDATISLCLSSRVAITGSNGAGKSTLVKLLLGELQPQSGTIFRHSGTRISYVAQQALHHLEKHLEKTPVEYILWRFAGNDDRESLENRNKADLSKDEGKLRQQAWTVDVLSGNMRVMELNSNGQPVTNTEKRYIPAFIDARRKVKMSSSASSAGGSGPLGGSSKYEYLTGFVGMDETKNKWLSRDQLINMGYERLILREDERQAAEKGLMLRPLTQESVEKHLKDVASLDKEMASHTPINKLAAGRKAQVAIAAALWMNPHLLCIDEPTNYLDRTAQKALVKGLNSFNGGVIVISHNREFSEMVASEIWEMSGPEQGEGKSGFLKRSGKIPNENDLSPNNSMKKKSSNRLRSSSQGNNNDNDDDEDNIDKILYDSFGNVLPQETKHTNVEKKRMKSQARELEKALKLNWKRETEGREGCLTAARKVEMTDRLAELNESLVNMRGLIR